MMMFFDANATTEMLPVVKSAINDWAAKGPLNASSAHSRGAIARSLLQDARETICDALGADDPENVVFVSSGTEANNIVVNGFARLNAEIIISAVEHASVVAPASATGGQTIFVGRDGVMDLVALKNALSHTSDKVVLVCVQAANSETGVIQPLDQISALCKAAPGQVFLHVDAAQAFGRIRLSIEGVDGLSFSGHKLHGPLGTGFLWMSDRLAEVLPRTVLGGGQERGFRSGTQNVPGIAGLRAAVAARFANFDKHTSLLMTLRDRFERKILEGVSDASVVCARSLRIPNTTTVRFAGAESDLLLAALDYVGVISSNGSACSSMKPSASAVLRAIGLSEKEAFNCLRFSFSILNSEEEVDAAIPLIADAVSRARARA